MRAQKIALLTAVMVTLLAGVAWTAPSKKSASKPATAKAQPTETPQAGSQPSALPGHTIEGLNIPSKTDGVEFQPITVPPIVQTQPSRSSAAPNDIKIDWLSINGGGETELTAGNIKMGVSIAQSVAGEVSAGNLKMGIGFWYGASGSSGVCECPFPADIDGSMAVDATDLQFAIDIIFFGSSDVTDPTCPKSRSDFDCSGFTDATDLQFLIDYIFFGGNPPCDGCLSAARASR